MSGAASAAGAAGAVMPEAKKEHDWTKQPKSTGRVKEPMVLYMEKGADLEVHPDTKFVWSGSLHKPVVDKDGKPVIDKDGKRVFAKHTNRPALLEPADGYLPPFDPKVCGRHGITLCRG